MAEIIVENERCKGCEMCVFACPKNLLTLNKEVTNSKGYHPVHITNKNDCIGCGSCAIMCPDMAIRVEA